METEEEILKKAIEKYGEKLQIVIGMEELAKLITACSKYFFRGTSSVDDVINELANVELVCKTIRMIINKKESVELVKLKKLNRLLDRINEK